MASPDSVPADHGPIVVTGAFGFLGSHVVRALLGRGRSVRAIGKPGGTQDLPPDLTGRVEIEKADVRDHDSLLRAIRGAHTVIHAAAVISVAKDPDGLLAATNVAGTRNVIRAGRSVGVKKLVHVSSYHAFAQHSKAELRSNSPLGFSSGVPYVASKAKAHQSVLDAVRSGCIEATILCAPGILGPGGARGPVGEMMLGIGRGGLPCLVRGGYWWCDVRDAADSIARAATREIPSAVHLLASRLAGIAELAELASASLNRDLRRPVVPLGLARAGLPLVAMYAALRGQLPLYSANALALIASCPPSVDFASAEELLGSRARPLFESVRDTMRWLQEAGLLE